MLTPKKQCFVAEYIRDLNATQAAIRAGYSPKTANQSAARLMNEPDVAAAIDAAKQARGERTKIDADFVLARLADELSADLADIYDATSGDLKPIEAWPLIWRQGLVAGVEIEALYQGTGEARVQVGQVKKIRLSDRIRRLELIGKHVAVRAFQEQIVVNALDGLADRLARAREDVDRRMLEAKPVVHPPMQAVVAPEPAAIEAVPRVAPPRQATRGDWDQPAPPSAPPSRPKDAGFQGDDYAKAPGSMLAARNDQPPAYVPFSRAPALHRFNDHDHSPGAAEVNYDPLK